MKRRKQGFTFIEKKKVLSIDLVREIFGTLFFCFAAVLLAVVLVIAFGMKTRVISSGMEPTLYDEQEVLIDRFIFKMLSPKRYDIVCFYPKGNENTHLYIRRVVGLPGETVEVKDGYLYVDGIRLLDDEYGIMVDPGLARTEFKLGPSEYFVLGDNRNNSEDSRIGNIGAVTKDTMIGRVWFKFRTERSKGGFV